MYDAFVIANSTVGTFSFKNGAQTCSKYASLLAASTSTFAGISNLKPAKAAAIALFCKRSGSRFGFGLAKCGFCIIISANGSKPNLIASVALVFFFSLNGRYKSSISTNFVAAKIEACNSSVNNPFSSIKRITSALRFSKDLTYS